MRAPLHVDFLSPSRYRSFTIQVNSLRLIFLPPNDRNFPSLYGPQERFRIAFSSTETGSRLANDTNMNSSRTCDSFIRYERLPLACRCLKSRPVKLVSIHEEWDPCTQEHDIAIIELLENVTFSKELAPICLPSKELKLAKLLRAAGAGMNLSAVVNDEAIILRLVYFMSHIEEDRKHGLIMTRENKTSLCVGDSGGPLFQFEHNRYTIVGTSIGGETHCLKKYDHFDNYFVDVRQHLDWICNITGICPI